MFKNPLIAMAFAIVFDIALAEPADITITKSFPLDLAEAVGEVLVISKEEIQDGSYSSVYDVLRSQPGVSVYRQGGDASLSKIRVAGFEDEQVTVLVDGANTNDPYWGNHRLEFIDLNQVERIEIVQGNSAVAFGGVSGAIVSIITTPQSTKDSMSISGGYASQNTKTVAAQIRRTIANDFVVSVSGNQITSDGYDVRADTDPDIDSFDKSSGNVAILRQFGTSEAVISVSKQQGRLMLDRDINEFNHSQDIVDHELTTAAFGYSTVIGNRKLEVKYNILELTDNNQNPLDPTDFSLIESDTQTGRISMTGTTKAMRYSVSADHLRQEREDQYGRTHAENFGVSTSIDFSNSGETISPFLVVRHDDNKDWGNHFGGTFGIKINAEPYDANLSIGSSYRPPNGSEAFSATEGERTNQINASLFKPLANSTYLSLRAIKATSLNRISQGAPNYGANIGKNNVNFASIEMGSQQQTHEWSVAYEYTDSRLEEHDWMRMPFIPESQVKARYTRFAGQHRLTTELYANDGYYTNYNEVAESRQAGYGDLNISHVYKSHSNWNIKTAIENVLDRQPTYEFLHSGTIQRFSGPGRFISVTLTYSL